MCCNITGISFLGLIKGSQKAGQAFSIRPLFDSNNLHLVLRFPSIPTITLSFNASNGNFEKIIRGEGHAIAQTLRKYHKSYLELLAKLYIERNGINASSGNPSWHMLLNRAWLFKLDNSPNENRVYMKVRVAGETALIPFDSTTCCVIKEGVSCNLYYSNEEKRFNVSPEMGEILKQIIADPYHYYSGLIAFAMRYLFE